MVLVCIDTCIWYVFVGIFDHFYKYTLIHTFATGDLRAGSCVRTRGPRFHWGFRSISHTVGNTSAWLWGHVHAQGDSQRALSCFEGWPPIGRRWAGTFRAAARSDAALGGSDSAAVKPATLRACRKLRWPCMARGAKIGAALVRAHVCIGMYPYIYWYVLIGIEPILACTCM